MSSDELRALERLAEDANHSGTWEQEGNAICVHSFDHLSFQVVAVATEKHSAAFIAAANPKVVLKLIHMARYAELPTPMSIHELMGCDAGCTSDHA